MYNSVFRKNKVSCCLHAKMAVILFVVLKAKTRNNYGYSKHVKTYNKGMLKLKKKIHITVIIINHKHLEILVIFFCECEIWSLLKERFYGWNNAIKFKARIKISDQGIQGWRGCARIQWRKGHRTCLR